MWNVEKLKTSSNQQELHAVIKIKELAECNISADAFLEDFKARMSEIKRTNNFEASFAYKAFKISENEIAIWKMKVNLDKNYQMFKLTKGANKPGPFDHL